MWRILQCDGGWGLAEILWMVYNSFGLWGCSPGPNLPMKGILAHWDRGQQACIHPGWFCFIPDWLHCQWLS